MRKYSAQIDGKNFSVEVLQQHHDSFDLQISNRKYRVSIRNTSLEKPKLASTKVASQELHKSAQVAPMPGIIAKVCVAEGQTVELGQTLLTIEAMKMENNINSERAGRVKKLCVSAGQEVHNNQVLLEFED